MPNFDDEESFTEYEVPLEYTAENIRRSRTFSGANDSIRSDRSLTFSDIVKEPDENALPTDFSDGRFSSKINRNHGNDDSLHAPRRRISSQTVSFSKSTDNDEEVVAKSSRNNSPSRLGMDGNIVQDSNDSKIAPTEFDVTKFNPQASQNFSVASSDATYRKRTLSYGNTVPGLYDGLSSPEEKRNPRASFDKKNSVASKPHSTRRSLSLHRRRRAQTRSPGPRGRAPR